MPKIQIPKVQYRQFAIRVDPAAEPAAGAERVYPMTFSSEVKVRRFDWGSWQYYDEVLGHTAAEVDLSRAARKLPLLKSHSRLLQIGSVRDIALDPEAKQLRGNARFSSIPLAQEQETLLREDHLDTVSVGYQVKNLKLVEVDKETGIPTYRAEWLPLEVSTEPVPADADVGFNRSLAKERAMQGDVELMELEVDQFPEPTERGERAMPPTEPTPTSQPVETPAGGGAPPSGRDFNAEALEIVTLANQWNLGARATDWIKAKLTPAQVREKILEEIQTRGTAQPSAEQLAGAQDAPAKPKDMRRYNYARALAMGLYMRHGGGKLEGLEYEVHQELARRVPEQSRRGGIFIPLRTERALDAKTAGKGAELVTDGAPAELIELLRNKAMVTQMGARTLTGLTSPVPFPKQTSGMTMHWVGENPGADVPDSDLGTGLNFLSPKYLMGMGKLSRQLLIMASMDVDAMVRDELSEAGKLAIDLGAIHGTGAGEPLGIYSAPGVQSVAFGGAPAYGKLIDMQTKLATANAPGGSLGYLTTPGLAGKMKQTLEASADGAGWLWKGPFENGEIAGYSARATNQVKATLGGGTEHGIIFGSWNDLIIGLFDGAEVIVDQYTLAGQAMVRIVSFMMADVLCRHGVSFVKGTGATA